jgi:hypothetical protein
VIATAIVCAALLESWLFRAAELWYVPQRAKRCIRMIAAGYLTLLVVIGLKLSTWGRADLEGFSARPLSQFLSLAHPLGDIDDPQVQALLAVMKQTGPRDQILVFPLDCQFYALTKRPISGRHTTYYPRLYNSPVDSERSLEAIRREMPKLVIVPADFDKAPEETTDVLVREARQSLSTLSVSSGRTTPGLSRMLAVS